MTSNRVVYASGDKVRARMLDMAVSEREVVKRTGVGSITLRAILQRNELTTNAQLADIQRLLTYLGLTYGDFFDPTIIEPGDDTVDDDVRTLAALLSTERIMHKHERLATALGWTLDRLRATIEHLDQNLRTIGLRVHANTMGVTIRADGDLHTSALQHIAAIYDADDGMKQGMARVLYAVRAGTMSTRETRNDHYVQLAALRNRDAITFGVGDDRYTLTEDVAFAFPD